MKLTYLGSKNLVSMDFAGAASSVVVDFVRIVRQVRV